MPRVGFGYDSHRYAVGRPLILAGVRVQHPSGLAGHSDADAVLHAVTDALLGALGAGDIGEHFPDSDPQWRGADSGLFVRRAVAMAIQAGLRVGNCDVTVLCESPKLSPYKPAMRASLAKLLGVGEAQVSVKAKTNEAMGWIGRGEGLAAMAVVMLEEEEEEEEEEKEDEEPRLTTKGTKGTKSRKQ
jgi:2-C-methyl-D-erythritol 4-phosphate cytidylyltransferase / 2-C-methyl-D-erythritol 2,4-cyclodiphosphate synthase